MLNGILIVYLFPGILLIIPLFAMVARIADSLGFNVQDNLSVLILTYLAQTLPVALYMLANYFRTIPREIEQAGLIDSCSRVSVIWRVTLPLAIPALVSVAIFTFMIVWNEFLYALTFTTTQNSRTIPVAIALFPGLHEVPWGEIAAASIMVTAPLVALVFLFQKRIIAGLTPGSIKG